MENTTVRPIPEIPRGLVRSGTPLPNMVAALSSAELHTLCLKCGQMTATVGHTLCAACAAKPDARIHHPDCTLKRDHTAWCIGPGHDMLGGGKTLRDERGEPFIPRAPESKADTEPCPRCGSPGLPKWKKWREGGPNWVKRVCGSCGYMEQRPVPMEQRPEPSPPESPYTQASAIDDVIDVIRRNRDELELSRESWIATCRMRREERDEARKERDDARRELDRTLRLHDQLVRHRDEARAATERALNEVMAAESATREAVKTIAALRKENHDLATKGFPMLVEARDDTARAMKERDEARAEAATWNAVCGNLQGQLEKAEAERDLAQGAKTNLEETIAKMEAQRAKCRDMSFVDLWGWAHK